MIVELCDKYYKQQQDIQHITVFGKDAHHLLFLHCYQECWDRSDIDQISDQISPLFRVSKR